MRYQRYKAGPWVLSGTRAGIILVGLALAMLPSATARAASADEARVSSSPVAFPGLGVPSLRLSGMGARLSLGLRVQAAGAPVTAGLSLGVAALQAPDEPDDSDLLPDLIPLVDLVDDAPAATTATDEILSFDAIDLTDDEREDSGGEVGPADAALSMPPLPELPPETERRSVLRRWWFWAAVGAAALAGGGVVAASSGPEIVLPQGTLGTLDRR